MKRNREKLKRSEKDARMRDVFERYYNSSSTLAELAAEYNTTPRTIFRWLRGAQDRLASSGPRPRKPRTRAKAFPPEVFERIEALKRENLSRSAAKIHYLLVLENWSPCPSVHTVRKCLAAKGLTAKDPRGRQGYVKFCRDAPNDLWQIDIAGVQTVGHLGKLYLVTILDDRSRFIVAAEYFRDQRGTNVLRTLRDAVEAYGRPNQLLADNGSQFKNALGELGTKYSRLLQVLGVEPIFAKPHHPQTKGQLERWFGTVVSGFLGEERRVIEQSPDATLADLNEHLRAWVHWYNCEKPHRSLPDYSTPAACFFDHPGRVHRPLEAEVDWDRWIATSAKRKVTKYNLITYKKEVIPVPPGYVKCRVEVFEGEGVFEVYFHDKCLATHVVDQGFLRIRDKKFLRRVNKDGYVKYKSHAYRLDPVLAGKQVSVRETDGGKKIAVYVDGVLYEEFAKRGGSKQKKEKN